LNSIWRFTAQPGGLLLSKRWSGLAITWVSREPELFRCKDGFRSSGHYSSASSCMWGDPLDEGPYFFMSSLPRDAILQVCPELFY